jgi:hypothetical protein
MSRKVSAVSFYIARLWRRLRRFCRCCGTVGQCRAPPRRCSSHTAPKRKSSMNNAQVQRNNPSRCVVIVPVARHIEPACGRLSWNSCGAVTWSGARVSVCCHRLGAKRYGDRTLGRRLRRDAVDRLRQLLRAGGGRSAALAPVADCLRHLRAKGGRLGKADVRSRSVVLGSHEPAQCIDRSSAGRRRHGRMETYGQASGAVGRPHHYALHSGAALRLQNQLMRQSGQVTQSGSASAPEWLSPGCSRSAGHRCRRFRGSG